jgi:hypothetical protein
LLVLASCHAAVPGEQALTYEVLAQGFQSGEHRAGATLITTDADWQAFWQRHSSWSIPPAPAPQVDFGVHSVIVVSAGDEPTSGWTLEMSSLVRSGGRILVRAVLHGPAGDRPVAQLVSQPFQILLVARTSGEIVLQLDQRGSSR